MNYNFIIKQNSTSFDDLLLFYKKNANLFIPNLYEQVESLNNYIDKLYKNAILLEAYNNNNIIGIIAMYLNDFKTKIGFISSVIVSEEYQGKGIANTLLETAINLAASKGFIKIKLEVSNLNKKAISFYVKIGFKNCKNERNVMELIIPPPPPHLNLIIKIHILYIRLHNYG